MDPRGVQPHVVGVATESARDLYSLPAVNCLRRSWRLAPGANAGEADSPNAQASLDDEGPLLAPEALSAQESSWALVLLLASAVDILGSLALAFFAFSYAYRDNGVSLYCLGIQAVSHFFSSMVAAMRFMGDLLPAREDMDGAVSDECLMREQRRRDLRREQALAVCMGMAMMMSSAGLLFKAFRKIRFWDVWYLDHRAEDAHIEKVTGLMAWWGFGGYSVQAGLRLVAAIKLQRSLPWHLFAVSVVSLIFFFALGVAASYEKEWSWKAEPIVAIFLVVVMLCESTRMVVTNLGDVDTTMRYDTRA